MIIRRSVLSATAAAILSVGILAQDQFPMRGPAAQRVEQLKKLRLMEALKLDEETSIRFFARYNEHQEELRGIGKNRAGAIDDLQSLARKDAPEGEIDAKLKEIMGIESEVLAARNKFLGKLKEVLSVRQVAQYVVFERNFNQDLRDMMRESAQERWRGRN